MDAKQFHDKQFITYRPYTQENFERIPQIGKLSAQQQFEIKVVSQVFPFKTNNYIINELIRWENFTQDPVYRLTFPQKEMLSEHDYNVLAQALYRGATHSEVSIIAQQIRDRLIPHAKNTRPHEAHAWQQVHPQRLLFFPAHADTCHAYCTFCYRWPQFAGAVPMHSPDNEAQWLSEYLHQHKNINELVLTGGDPLMMQTETLAQYLAVLLGNKPAHLKTITILTKTLSYWPYRFTLDSDADTLALLLESIVHSGIRLVIMAHFTHPAELNTRAALLAIQRIRHTGAEIRTQAPLLRHINDSPTVWAEMWRKQREMGCTPQHMLVTHMAGLQHYFALPLHEALDVYQKAATLVGDQEIAEGGPVMNCAAGKIRLRGNTEKTFTLDLLQARDPEWENKPFTAAYDTQARWINELKPETSEKFFFEKALEKVFDESIRDPEWEGFD